MTSAEFMEYLQDLLEIGDRQVRMDNRGYSHHDTSVFVHYYNLPHGVGGAGGGAEGENNRLMLVVRGFGRAPDDATDKVKVETSVSALKNPHAPPGSGWREQRWTLRAKTGKPEAIAEYIAKFLNKTADEVPPNFTHTRM